MAATAEISFLNRDALPVCLFPENPHRLVSLWDILNQFDVHYFSALLGLLYSGEQRLATLCETAGPGTSVPDNERELMLDTFAKLRKMCWEAKLKTSQEHIYQVEGQTRTPTSADAMRVLIYSVRNTLINELVGREFLYIDPRRNGYIDQEELFGGGVKTAFPSARMDIKETGNCLAVECSTAAVFHLMRVAEHGLRALAFDRNITVPKGPIDLATWDEIIRKLEDVEQAIQGYPKTLAREEQFDFYHGAMMEFKRFKNKFRNRIMHTRDEYDSDEAHSAFVHVKEFMNILASKIAENVRTPEIWV